MSEMRADTRLVDMTLGDLQGLLSELADGIRKEILATQPVLSKAEDAPVEEVLRVGDAATLLKCSKGNIYHLVSRRQIPHHKRGGQVVFLRHELEQWQRGRYVPTAHDIALDASKHTLASKRKNIKK